MRRSRAVFITAIIYALIGLVIAGGGIWLAALGGSVFYVILGVGILATSALLLAQRRSALWLFAIVLVGTLAWAGGPMTTAGGVAFYTGTYEYTIRAYDVRNGKVVWEDRLPAGAQSTPMSYEVDGKQYVVTAAGGHGSFGTKRGDYVIAYTLKD